MAELEQTDWEKIEQEIKEAEFVLVGIGKRISQYRKKSRVSDECLQSSE